MLTRDDFRRAIGDSITRYPSLGALYQTQDPRLLQHIDAMASMLALYSSQLEVAMAEPFAKARDATVMADAAMRGLVPKATPARITVAAQNGSNQSITLDAGRELRDTSGRSWLVETPVTLDAGTSGTFEASQVYTATTAHTVAGSRPFYAVEIPLADDDSRLSGLVVSDYAGPYLWRDRYTNIFADERVFHVETDERQRVYVRFGQDGVVGTQPIDGTEITIQRFYSLGYLETLAADLPLAPARMNSPNEVKLSLSLSSVLTRGESPPSIDLLRDLARYPAIYNRNAVFLGEFDFLVRSHFPSLQWLSVWNEGVEERVRGMSLDNVNTLFVAVLSGTGDETVLTQAPGETVEPVETDAASLTGTQTAIRDVIWQADDSYKVRFFSPVRAPLTMSIDASVASAYDESAVHAQIRAVILEEYGEDSARLRRGQSLPRYQAIYKMLRERVPALGVEQSDLRVTIQDCDEPQERPELWRYVAPDSLTVSVSGGNVCVPFHGAGWGTGL